jgi:hypothetical protein
MTRYTVLGKIGTCGHKHRLLGKAQDCADRLLNATIFCKHGKLIIPARNCCRLGCIAPLSLGNEWERPVIKTV